MTKPVVYIIIYSLYHHVYKLSLSVKEGLEKQGVDVQLFQVQETLSDDILAKMQAREKLDLPFITVDKLSEPDGILFGFPTRFGTIPAQMKAFLDASGALWAKGALAGKFVGTFFSTASQHGGQETTALTTITYFAHHGMLYVPFGFANSEMNRLDQVVGGSAYGAGTIANGDGSRQPTEAELSIAVNQGVNFGNVVTTFVKGRDSVNSTIQNKSTDVNGAAAGSNTADAGSNTADATPNTAGTTTNAADTTNNTAGDGVPTGLAAGTDTPSGTTTDNQHKGATALGAAAAATGVGATGAAITAANSKNNTTAVDNNGTINNNSNVASANNNVASVNDKVASTNNGVASTNDGIASTNNGIASTNNGVASANNGTVSANNGTVSANNGVASANNKNALTNDNSASAVTSDKAVVGASATDNTTSAAPTANPSTTTAVPNSNAKTTPNDLPATSNNPTTATDATNNAPATNVHPVKESRVETNKAKDNNKKSCFCM